MSKHLYRAGPFNNGKWFSERFIYADTVEEAVKRVATDLSRVIEESLLAEQKKLITVDIYTESVREIYRKNFERNIKRYAQMIEDLANVKTEDDLTLIPIFKHFHIEKLFPINA